MACHDARHSDILVQLFPAQGISIYFNLDSGKLLFVCLGKNAKPVSRKSDNSPIMQLHINRPPLGPGPHGSRFNR